MRKKSHLSLAWYLMKELRLEELAKHKKAFYIGSILPDLTPKMITSPHQFMTSFEGLQMSIREIAEDAAQGLWRGRVRWRRIGVIMHYLADYFTFPHNTSYDGNLKDHCIYERDMKYCLRAYVKTPEAKMIFRRQYQEALQIASVNELLEDITERHLAYMQGVHTVEDDCRWIVEQCSRVLICLTMMIDEKYMDRHAALGWAA